MWVPGKHKSEPLGQGARPGSGATPGKRTDRASCPQGRVREAQGSWQMGRVRGGQAGAREMSGDQRRPGPDAGLTQHGRGSSEARHTAPHSPGRPWPQRQPPGLCRGGATRGRQAPEGQTESQAQEGTGLVAAARRGHPVSFTPRGTDTLFSTWAPQGSLGLQRSVGGRKWGVPLGSSPGGGALGPGREGAVWGIPDPELGGGRSSGLDDAWTAAERSAPPAGWTAPHLQPPQPPAHPGPLTGGTRPRPGPASWPAPSSLLAAAQALPLCLSACGCGQVWDGPQGRGGAPTDAWRAEGTPSVRGGLGGGRDPGVCGGLRGNARVTQAEVPCPVRVGGA